MTLTADRAKSIKTSAVINESPTDKLIRELREENEKLKKMLAGGKIPEGLDMEGDGGGDSGSVDGHIPFQLSYLISSYLILPYLVLLEMKKEMEEAMRRNQEEMEAMEASWQEKLKAQEEELKVEYPCWYTINFKQLFLCLKKRMADDQKSSEDKKSIPHFWNLNEDPALTGMVSHFCKAGSTTIGNNKAEKTPDIVLNGLG
jgi:hypothetical protein